MKKFFTYAMMFAVSVAGMVCVSACSDDNDGPDDSKELVSPDVPKEGWSGNMTDGIATYNSGTDEDANCYLAFSFKGGRCLEGVCNVMFPSDRIASAMAGMLKDGNWLASDVDNPDYGHGVSATGMLNDIVARNPLSAVPQSRAGGSTYMPVPVKNKGKVVYADVPSVNGFTARDVMDAVAYWNDDYEGMPDRVLFGHYENGKYSFDNAMGIGARYEIATRFSNGYCDRFDITITFPTEDWAEFYYGGLSESVENFRELFGGIPQIKRSGKTLTVKNSIINRLSQLHIEALISGTDWENGCPVLYSLFD